MCSDGTHTLKDKKGVLKKASEEIEKINLRL
jgi:hypothetical protein